MDPRLPSLVAVERADHPVAQLVHPFQQVEGSHARDAWTVRGLALGRLVNPTALCGDTSAASIPAPHRLRSLAGSRSRRMPCEPLDVPDDLREQALSQLTFGQLQDEGRAEPDAAGAQDDGSAARDLYCRKGSPLRRVDGQQP